MHERRRRAGADDDQQGYDTLRHRCGELLWWMDDATWSESGWYMGIYPTPKTGSALDPGSVKTVPRPRRLRRCSRLLRFARSQCRPTRPETVRRSIRSTVPGSRHSEWGCCSRDPFGENRIPRFRRKPEIIFRFNSNCSSQPFILIIILGSFVYLSMIAL